MEYQIIKLIQETKDTKTFRLKPVKGKVFDFKPGHFVILSAELMVNGNLQIIKRAYSISSIPNNGSNNEYIDLTIKELPNGLMSKHVMTLKVGNTMDIAGPYGNFVYEDAMKDAVFISGGYAQMPFYSMINYIFENKLDVEHGVKITKIISARTPEDVVFKYKFMELTKKHKNFRFFITYTKVEKNPEFGFVGRLDKDKLTAMIRNTNGVVDPKKIKTQGY